MASRSKRAAPSCLANPGLVPYPRGTRPGFFACSGTVWAEDATKLLNTRPVFTLCPVLGLVVAGSDSVCQFRVCSCVLGRCTRSVGNAPLLNGCSAPDRVHRPVTGAVPPLGRCFWWWCGCLPGSWVPSCLAARETWQPRFARSRRLDIPESSGRRFRPGCPCGGWPKMLSAIPGANQSIGSAHWWASAAIRWT